MIALTLTHNQLGTIRVIPDAKGQDDLEQTIKRSDENDGIVFEYSLDLEFTKVPAAWLDKGYLKGGRIQSYVSVLLHEYDPNRFIWEQIGTGKIKFTNSERGRLVFKTSIEQTGFEKKVLNQLDTPVDVDIMVSQGGVPLPETPSVNLTMHAKKVLEEYKARPTDSNEYQQLNVMRFSISGDPTESNVDREAISTGSIDTGDVIFKELEGAATSTWQFARNPNPDMGTGPKTVSDYITYLALPSIINSRSEIYRAQNAGVANIKNRLNLKFKVTGLNTGGDIDTACPGGDVGGIIPYIEVHAWCEHRSSDNTIKFIEHIGEWDLPGCGGDDVREGVFQSFDYEKLNVNIAVGDKVYVYTTVRIFGTFDPPALSDGVIDYTLYVTAERCDTFINIVSATTFPRSTAKGYMAFEYLKKIAQFYTDQVDCFRSAYFGRTDSIPAYPQDGPGSLLAIVGGRAIRNGVLLEPITGGGDPEEPGDVCPQDEEPDEDSPVNTSKTMFGNLEDAFSSLNGHHCLGMGIERHDGKQVLVVEPISYFYDKDTLVLDLGVVSNLKRKPYVKGYAAQVEAGYTKLDIQKTNGIDEFCTGRTYKTSITEVASKLLNKSKYKSSGYEIEDQRRLIGSTKDSKLDDANFFVSLLRDLSEPSGYKTERNENFPVVENLYDPASSYNLRLSPGRALRRWSQVLAAMVVGITDKVVKFSSGDGNYFMRSRMNTEASIVDEKGDLDLTNVQPLWENEIYTFERKTSRDDFRRIRTVPYGYYTFREYENGPRYYCFMRKVNRSPKKNLGTFEMIKMFRND